jgi:HK97 family phage portal protein
MGLWSRLMGAPDIGAQDRYIDEWLRGMEGGITSATGLRVNVPAALTSPGIAACIQVQSEDLAKVPLTLKRRSADGYDEAVEHPLFGLLKYGPSPWLSSYRWRKALVHVAMAHGNHFSRVWRSEAGLLDYITPLQVGRTAVRWADDGEPFFDILSPTGLERGLTWQDVIHVGYRESTDDTLNGGVLGVSPILQNKETVALMLAAEKFAAVFFANGAMPSMILEYDKKLPDDDTVRRIRAGIERVYGGLDGKWKVAILELGLKMRETSFDPSKTQLTETRKLGGVMAATMYRTPPHKIGILDNATFSNIEQQSIDYVTGPLSALAQSVEQALTIACLTPDERVVYKIEHNLEGLMRGDILSRYRAYAIARQWGWASVNEIKRRENENTIGPDGDEYLVPMNMTPSGQPLQDGEVDPKKPGNDADAGWMASDVQWSVPAAFRTINRSKPKARRSSLTGPNGETLFLH